VHCRNCARHEHYNPEKLTGIMPELQVTEAELRRYHDFVFQNEIAKTGRRGSGTLWHYTSGDGLIGILQSGEFWVTQVSCVNDAVELRYAQAILLRNLKQARAESRLPDDEANLLDRAVLGLSADPTPSSPWFVGCLSEHADDLSQWRAYGGGEGGYALAFDTATLHTILHLHQIYLAGVCYDPDVHEDIARSVVQATLAFYREGLAARPGADAAQWAHVFLQAWSNELTYIAPIIKHPAFSAEMEWRLLRQLREPDLPNLKYRQRQSMMARHLPLALRLPYAPAGSRLLPISGVLVGPSRHKDLSVVSVATMLRTIGYPEQVYKNVKPSQVPFQAP
jgi:hypothetical protein